MAYLRNAGIHVKRLPDLVLPVVLAAQRKPPTPQGASTSHVSYLATPKYQKVHDSAGHIPHTVAYGGTAGVGSARLLPGLRE